jgi:hypothetical protein
MSDPRGEGPVIVNAFCNFIKQLEYPGEVWARHYVANPGRSSFDTYMTLERTDDPGVVYASGGATAVWVDFPRQKSAPLPERLHRFADLSSVEGFLDELAARPDEKGGALVVKLPRAPGAREPRWAHLLSGAVDTSAMPVAAVSAVFVAASELVALKAQQGAMQAELSELRGLVERLYAELGVART